VSAKQARRKGNTSTQTTHSENQWVSGDSLERFNEEARNVQLPTLFVLPCLLQPCEREETQVLFIPPPSYLAELGEFETFAAFFPSPKSFGRGIAIVTGAGA